MAEQAEQAREQVVDLEARQAETGAPREALDAAVQRLTLAALSARQSDDGRIVYPVPRRAGGPGYDATEDLELVGLEYDAALRYGPRSGASVELWVAPFRVIGAAPIPGAVACERCARVTLEHSADCCVWWPDGCSGDTWRVCPECQTDAEVRELAERGCSAAAFRAGAL